MYNFCVDFDSKNPVAYLVCLSICCKLQCRTIVRLSSNTTIVITQQRLRCSQYKTNYAKTKTVRIIVSCLYVTEFKKCTDIFFKYSLRFIDRLVHTKFDYIRRLRKICIGFFNIGYVNIIITRKSNSRMGREMHKVYDYVTLQTTYAIIRQQLLLLVIDCNPYYSGV